MEDRLIQFVKSLSKEKLETLVITYADKNEKLMSVIEEQAIKVDFFDRAMESEDTFEMSEVAKVLNYKKLGRNKLFFVFTGA